MKMKKFLIFGLTLFLSMMIQAQNDHKAIELLDKTFAKLSNDSGIRASFVGTESGDLLLKGEKFHLNNGKIQSWYDGKTQWSYVVDMEEVNISIPTHEELQSINPYHILKEYKRDYTCTYKGLYVHNGKNGFSIMLTPKYSTNQEIIYVVISEKFQPLAMKIEQNGRIISDINITSYQTNQKLGEKMFRFDKSLYPNAEIIDLR